MSHIAELRLYFKEINLRGSLLAGMQGSNFFLEEPCVSQSSECATYWGRPFCIQTTPRLRPISLSSGAAGLKAVRRTLVRGSDAFRNRSADGSRTMVENASAPARSAAGIVPIDWPWTGDRAGVNLRRDAAKINPATMSRVGARA